MSDHVRFMSYKNSSTVVAEAVSFYVTCALFLAEDHGRISLSKAATYLQPPTARLLLTRTRSASPFATAASLDRSTNLFTAWYTARLGAA